MQHGRLQACMHTQSLEASRLLTWQILLARGREARVHFTGTHVKKAQGALRVLLTWKYLVRSVAMKESTSSSRTRDTMQPPQPAPAYICTRAGGHGHATYTCMVHMHGGGKGGLQQKCRRPAPAPSPPFSAFLSGAAAAAAWRWTERPARRTCEMERPRLLEPSTLSNTP